MNSDHDVHLVIPHELFNELGIEAFKRGITTIELIRTFIKLGMLAMYIENSPDAALIIRDDDGNERELLLI